MFLKSETLKFTRERDHYLIQNAKTADELTDRDFELIADHAGVNLSAVLEDAKVYGFDLRTHKPQM